MIQLGWWEKSFAKKRVGIKTFVLYLLLCIVCTTSGLSMIVGFYYLFAATSGNVILAKAAISFFVFTTSATLAWGLRKEM
jgi:hypothetical protein